MISLLRVIQFGARRVKPASIPNQKTQQENLEKPQRVQRKKIKQNPQKKSNLKFSQEELTNMSNPNRRLRTPYNKVIQQKLRKKQSKQKGQNDQKAEKILYEKKISMRSVQQKFTNFIITRPITRTEGFSQQQEKDQSILDQLCRIRLDNIFLPISYLKKVQKVFHRYDQEQLRQIAKHFSSYVALRYTEEKFNYDLYPELKFEKLQQKIRPEKKIQQIYLTGEQKIYEEKEQTNKRKVDEDPTKPEINYTQNVTVSYLLNRAPRAFATALRIFIQVKYKYPQFSPVSMIDFGSGLSAGSYAFMQAFPKTVELYNIQPASKMRKMSKYLTQDTRIQHYQSLGQLSRTVQRVDVVYAGYVINQIKPQLVEVYLQALLTKVKPGGLLIISQYGNPFGARLIHQTRKWALDKKAKLVAPCPHMQACPLAKGKQWCHFDQPAGMYPKRIFGTLPTDQAIQLEKFSYLVIKKSQEIQPDQDLEIIQKLELKQNITKQWDRVVFPTMKRGGHILMNLCTKQGKYERRISAKSHGQEYKVAKKLRWGDLWRFAKRVPNKYRRNRKTGQKVW